MPDWPPSRSRAAFSRAGFTSPDRAARSWREGWTRLPADSALWRYWEETWRDLVASADPDLALACLVRWIEGGLEEGDLPERDACWRGSRDYRRGFVVLAGVSPALGEILAREWASFRPLAWNTGWETRLSCARRLEEEVRGGTETEFLDRIRRFRDVELLRISTMDCVAGVSVRQITRQISVLADTLVEKCLERALEETGWRLGCRPPRHGFSVLALGKLGGQELNYSSDIDLNFIRDEGVREIGRIPGRSSHGGEEPEFFFTRVAETLISYVTRFTSRGQLYRLDARLRPEGGSGRLVWSVRASVDYYYSVGRTWERQALIRMRHLAGDADLSRRLRRELQDFIFPPTLSAEEIVSMRDLKLQSEKMARDRGEAASEIKIGEGGIRDVEYIVQYLQLLYGARSPRLTAANLFDALEPLEQAGHLGAVETDVLRQGYRFLRRVEHRLQIAHMLRTHRLPDDPAELRRLARGLGYESENAFRARLAVHSRDIRRVYRLLFEQAAEEQPIAETLSSLLDLPSDAVRDDATRILGRYGFQDPEAAFTRVRALAGQELRLLDAPATRKVFRRILPDLLRAISQQAEPDQTIANLEECVRSLGARSIFYQLLAESPDTMRLFVEVSARSTLVVETIRQCPDVFDELIDSLWTGYRFDRRRLAEEVDALLAEGTDVRAELFDFKYLHLLLTAIRDLEGTEKLRVTLERITDIAEAVLRGILREQERRAEQKMGAWAGAAPRYVVLGLGKLGGQEMSYRSDVDLVFLYDGDGITGHGVGSAEYHERFSQLVLGACKVADARGPLLEVDVRLRPLGSHNSLMISLPAWKSYFTSGSARTWERQAFLRARPIAGDASLGEEALGFIRREIVLGGSAGPPDSGSVRRDVWEMRRKIERHAGSSSLKRGRGGIVDLEFLVQALQLLHGREHPEVLVPGTALAIERLGQAGLLPEARRMELFTAYKFLRWTECRLALVSERGRSLSDLSEEALEATIQKMGYRASSRESAADIFRSELNYYRGLNRRALEEVLEIPPGESGPSEAG